MALDVPHVLQINTHTASVSLHLQYSSPVSENLYPVLMQDNIRVDQVGPRDRQSYVT